MLDKISDPQTLLEEAFKALYESNLAAELSEIAKQQDMYAYQKAWCERFAQVFSFVAKYGASVEVCELDRYLVEFRGIKYKVVVKKIGYSFSVQPPEPGKDKCKCAERFMLGTMDHDYVLTLPEITAKIAEGLAKYEANKDRITG